MTTAWWRSKTGSYEALSGKEFSHVFTLLSLMTTTPATTSWLTLPEW